MPAAIGAGLFELSVECQRQITAYCLRIRLRPSAFLCVHAQARKPFAV